jgi:hypothetical protein
MAERKGERLKAVRSVTRQNTQVRTRAFISVGTSLWITKRCNDAREVILINEGGVVRRFTRAE